MAKGGVHGEGGMCGKGGGGMHGELDSSCRKVMFSQASVILSMGGGVVKEVCMVK